ncbi:MAG: DUF4105 domain-containing protein [Spirochaetaceae bacterium]|jgi:hypothetical protein|nr:DUF4105 domain-containing protein [Spirochaetaceae bacterium]
MKTTRIFILVMMFILFPYLVFSAENNRQEGRGDYLTIKIAVIGPGDELYFWWGHLGLIIQDAFNGKTHFVDYGVFSFNSNDFFSDFALGRLWYTTSDSPAELVFQRYIDDNRDITLYTLNLSTTQKEKIFNRTVQNLLPQNKDYLYNHFSDNCVTRITNTLDEALGGQFYEKASQTPGRFTLRQEVRRYTEQAPLWDLLLNFLMGQVIDNQISVKEEMFLPDETGNFIENFTYIDGNGKEQKLCSEVTKLYSAQGRPPALDSPRSNIISSLVAGILIAALFWFIQRLGNKFPVVGRKLFGIGNTLLGLVAGIPGSVLFFMEFFTNHDYTYQNSNILFANPLLLFAIPFGLMFAFGKNEKKLRFRMGVLRILWTYVFLGASLAIIIKISPVYHQDNWAQLALILPVSIVLSKVSLWLRLLLKGFYKRGNT